MIALVAGAGCDWTQFGFDGAQTNYNPSESALTASSVRNLGLAWFCDTCSTVWSTQVVVADGTVFGPGAYDMFIRRQDILALDAATGATKWIFHGGPAYRVIGVANGLVYTTVSISGQLALVALDEATGAFRWGAGLPAPDTSFTTVTLARVRASLAFVLTVGITDAPTPTGGVISAVDTTGHVVWSATPGGDVKDVAVTDDGVTALWSETLAVAPFVRTHLTTYAVTDGHVVHSVSPTLDDGAGHGLTPAHDLTMGNGVAYFTAGSSTAHGLFAVDTATGDTRWSEMPTNAASLVLASGTLASVAAFGGTGALVARDAVTGAVHWSADAPTTAGQGTSLTGAGGLLYVAGAGIDIYSLADGSHAGRFAPPGAYAYAAIPSEGHVYAFFPAGLLALKPS